MDKDFEEKLSERLSFIFEKYSNVDDNDLDSIELFSIEKKKTPFKRLKNKNIRASIKNKPIFFINKHRNKAEKLEKNEILDYKFKFNKIYTKTFLTNNFNEILNYLENFDE